jgi:hypothetical protein
MSRRFALSPRFHSASPSRRSLAQALVFAVSAAAALSAHAGSGMWTTTGPYGGFVTTVEDVKAQTLEIGRGKIDWVSVFAACDPKHLKHYFVEQENFTGPSIDAVRASFEYLSSLKS